MSFLETVEKARAFLQRNGRISLRVLQREFDLEDGALEELVAELVEIQGVALREGRALAWSDGAEPLATRSPPSLPSAERSPRDYTPRHLAERILTHRSALEGERKQVTVLFADVKGSMELSEAMDPEEWHRILERFFQILSDGVHRFEGTVNQYTGDGIMALFGAPIAHEDHAQRACYAALWLRDALRDYADALRMERGLSFSVRMGLNSGEVVVGKIGDDLRMDYTAQGHTVGVAARMQQIAAADRVNLAGPTASLVEGYFALRRLGSPRLKGVAEPVPVYELEGVGRLRTRFDLSRARGLTRFVGRADEMATLEAALERAIEGQGQLLGILGQAGVGKSRLCFELAERCRERGISIREAHAVPHGKSIPLLPVLEMLRAIFGIDDRDGDRSARQKIAGAVMLLDRELESGLPLLFELLGVPDPERPVPRAEPEARERQLSELFRRLVEARSRREPGVMLFEDLHWLDGASEAFLENLAEMVPATRTLLLVNFRPEYHAEWMQHSPYQQLSLLPLGAAAVRELLAGLLGSHPSLADLGDRIFAHTGGNPFFVEEVVRSLAESGELTGEAGAYRLRGAVSELAIPPNVQALLAARIDRLPERGKRLLQTASVIGRRFAEPILRQVAGLSEEELAEGLRWLIRSEFLYEEALYPEAEYAFAHPLTHEVALRSQLAERRRTVHAAVARALEDTNAERGDDRAALLAHHWEEAGEALPAARWHRRAAVWAGMAQTREALRHWSRIRELLREVAETEETLELGIESRVQMLNLGVRARPLEEDADTLYREAEALAQRSGRSAAHLPMRLAYGIYQVFEGMAAEGVETLRETVRMADTVGDPTLRLVTRFFLQNGILMTGPYAEGVTLNDEILALQEKSPGLGTEFLAYDIGSMPRAWRAWFLASLGRIPEAIRDLRRARDLARGVEDPGVLLVAEAISAFVVSAMVGDGQAGLAHARRAMELTRDVEAATALALADDALGTACIYEERWDEAVTMLERGTERGPAIFSLSSGPLLARAWLGRGDPERAHRLAQETIASARRAGAGRAEADAQLSLAEVLLAAEGAPAQREIEGALDRARELLTEIGNLILLPRVSELRAELMGKLGDAEARERELREAHRVYVEMGTTGHAERLARELGS
jgi:class 3 adenylate cyclase/tetratricopeptide (TPR) repeat protein